MLQATSLAVLHHPFVSFWFLCSSLPQLVFQSVLRVLCLPHYSKSQIFVQKFKFDQNHNIFTSFSPKKIDNFLGKSKLNFWTKNEDFEQCEIAFLSILCSEFYFMENDEKIRETLFTFLSNLTRFFLLKLSFQIFHFSATKLV